MIPLRIAGQSNTPETEFWVCNKKYIYIYFNASQKKRKKRKRRKPSGQLANEEKSAGANETGLLHTRGPTLAGPTPRGHDHRRPQASQFQLEGPRLHDIASGSPPPDAPVSRAPSSGQSARQLNDIVSAARCRTRCARAPTGRFPVSVSALQASLALHRV